MQPVTIRFPDDVYAALQAARIVDDRSFNGEVVHLLRDELTRRGILPGGAA